MKKLGLILLFAILIATVSGCSTNGQNSELMRQIQEKDNKIISLENEIKSLEQTIDNLSNEVPPDVETETPQVPGPIASSNNILSTTFDVLELLKNKSMEDLAEYVHPVKGVRFSPYDYIDLSNDIVFSADDVATLNSNTLVYTWGQHHGSGDPISMNFNDYYDNYIFDLDFTNPQMIGNQMIIGKGNMINNIVEAYPGGSFCELHFAVIDPQYSGMDWRSLRLIFEDYNGLWYLVGISHGEWTT